MLRSLRLRGIIVTVLALLLMGCATVTLGPSATATPDGLLLTTREVPAVTPSPTPTTVPTPTPDPCPPRQDIAVPDRPAGDFPTSHVAALRDYLAAGGDPSTLLELLSAWEALAPEGGTPRQADLTGDGATEIAVVFIDPLAESFPPEGVLAVYACRAGSVETLYTYTPGEYFYLYLLGVEDLTADGLAELTFADVTCGAHTCWHTVHVWSWTGSDFQERVGGNFTMPYPDFFLREGQIKGRSQGMGSVGAGPQRVYTETWAWNGSVITYTSAELGPPTFRYHAFLDGEDALLAEEYATAFDLYLRVLDDESLTPWAAYYDAHEERLWLAALARWRLLTLGLELGNHPDAELQYERLQADFPPGIPGAAVAQLAQHFWEEYLGTGNVAYGCLEAVNAPEAPEVLDFLNSFGYANPPYAAEKLCPFLTP